MQNNHDTYDKALNNPDTNFKYQSFQTSNNNNYSIIDKILFSVLQLFFKILKSLNSLVYRIIIKLICNWALRPVN